MTDKTASNLSSSLLEMLRIAITSFVFSLGTSKDWLWP